jgi:phage anti-repressor protein
MTPFKTFYFENIEFDYKTLVASFFYSFDKKVKFTEKIDFTSCTNHDEYFEVNKKLDKKIVENILFHLHLAV